MEQLQSLEIYKKLLAKNRLIYRHGYNNNYLSLEMLRRYIKLGRIYYQNNENGLFFYTDEDRYYRLYFQIISEADVKIQKLDKPILVRNVYRENSKSELRKQVEKQLRKQGFELYDESVQIVIHPLKYEERIRTKQKKTEAFLNRMGIRILYAKSNCIEEIQALRDKTPELKPYHFFYETDDEIMQNIEKGYYRCAFDGSGKLCAAQQFSIENRGVQGNWLAVREEYKAKYGIGAAMAYHSFVYAMDRNISNYFGWVVKNNEQSIKYHESIGYEITDKMADEWLLR